MLSAYIGFNTALECVIIVQRQVGIFFSFLEDENNLTNNERIGKRWHMGGIWLYVLIAKGKRVFIRKNKKYHTIRRVRNLIEKW